MGKKIFKKENTVIILKKKDSVIMNVYPGTLHSLPQLIFL